MESAALTSQTLRSPSDRLLAACRALLVSVAAGALVGIVVGGLGSRLVMRIVAIVGGDSIQGATTENGNTVGHFTAGGTIALVIFAGLAPGIFGGLVHAAIHGFLPKGKLMHGAVFGLFLLFTFGAPVIDPNNDDFVQFRYAGVSIALFGLLFLLFGLLMGFTAPLFDHLVPRIQQEGRRRWLLLVVPSSALVLAVASGLGGPLGLLILGLVLLLGFALIRFGRARIGPLAVRIAGIVRMPAIPAKRKTAALLIALVIPPVAGGALLLSRVIEILYP